MQKVDSYHFRGNEIIERKIRYDSSIVDSKCIILNADSQSIVVFYHIKEPFSININQVNLTVPKDSYTTAYYWKNKPYNLYFWRNKNGEYIASYFNIVKNTKFEEKLVSFEDLIIDVLALPNGNHIILDEDELPEPLEKFENGNVKRSLDKLLSSIDGVLSETRADAETIYHHNRLSSLLKDSEDENI